MFKKIRTLIFLRNFQKEDLVHLQVGALPKNRYSFFFNTKESQIK